MAKDREQAARDAETRITERILKIALPLIPAKHLDIWAKAKIQLDDVSPAEVWRALMGDPRLSYDYKTTLFIHSNNANKEAI